MTKREMIIAFIKDMLRPRTLEEIIGKEMREAYISKMEAEKALEYATSVVDYNRQRIRRLEERLNELKESSDAWNNCMGGYVDGSWWVDSGDSCGGNIYAE